MRACVRVSASAYVSGFVYVSGKERHCVSIQACERVCVRVRMCACVHA